MNTKRLEMLESMIQKGTQDPFIYYARALEYKSLGDTQKSFEALKEITSQFTEYLPTYLMIAQIAVELGQHNEARVFAQNGKRLAQAQGNLKALSELQGVLDELSD